MKSVLVVNCSNNDLLFLDYFFRNLKLYKWENSNCAKSYQQSCGVFLGMGDFFLRGSSLSGQRTWAQLSWFSVSVHDIFIISWMHNDNVLKLSLLRVFRILHHQNTFAMLSRMWQTNRIIWSTITPGHW